MIKITMSSLCGFCPGVQSAVDKATSAAADCPANGGKVYCLGQLSHNQSITQDLEKKGVIFIDSLDTVSSGDTVIIRSHGEGEKTYQILAEKNAKIVDATCPFVKKIHKLVKEHDEKGYKVVIVGTKGHAEVQGISGWCNNAMIIDENSDLSPLETHEKICVVAQTTSEKEKYIEISKKIEKLERKTVEIFDTICYTTSVRQKDAKRIAEKSDIVIVVGSSQSSNTKKLFDIANRICETHLVTDVKQIKNIRFLPSTSLGLLAGASTPKESVMEVIDFMSQNVGEVTVSEELKAGVEESLMSYREGKRVKGVVISADDKGVRLNIGGKYDGIIYAAETSIEGEYNPANYAEGSELEAIIIGGKDKDTDCIQLSKRKLDLIKEGDKVVDSIRGGEVFELIASSVTKGGLLAKLGTYTVFIPSSQIKEKGYPKDLNVYVKKTLRLTALDIDDTKHKIVASQKKVLDEERTEREEIFWTHVKPNIVVNGTVKRITNFGAFVSVDGFDCLAHIVDLSWNHIKTVEEVLKKDESYDFLVLSADKEKGRVSLGYKQLQPHPYVVALQNHPVGSICKGKVVSIVPFGAFVQIEPGIEGLVHVSEAAHSYVKNINEVAKVGDEVDVMVLAVDEGSRRITLSMKACLPEEAASESFEAPAANEKRAKSSKTAKSDEKNSWNEVNSNNPFADLLKDMDITDEKK